jgi:hypothetical protein
VVAVCGEYAVLICGALLGFCRQGSTLPWDDDVDFGILEDHREDIEKADWASHGLALHRGPSHLYRVCFAQGGQKIPVQLNGVFKRRYTEWSWPFADIFIMEPMKGAAGNGLHQYKGRLHRDNFPLEAGVCMLKTKKADVLFCFCFFVVFCVCGFFVLLVVVLLAMDQSLCA